jgi:hypothetical protein
VRPKALREVTPMTSRIDFTRAVLLVSVQAALLGLGVVWGQDEQPKYSHARVVRLSFVEGTVTVQRPDVADWSTAPVNTPIQEGFKLSTAENSFAEVEFENALSTARIGQLSLLEFSQLALAPDGGKRNRLTLSQGYGTFHFVPSEQDMTEVRAGDTTVTPDGKAEFRVDLEQGQVRVEVFKGSVEASGPQGSETLTKNMVLQSGADGSFDVAQGITKDAWDEWVQQRGSEEVRARAQAPAFPGASSTGASSGLYGWNDLSYYGDWGSAPGYGSAWFPNVAYGWAPYTYGRWAWYSGFGYTWISAEPWGWLPFHFGSWLFDPAFGWFWVPGDFGYWSPALVTWYQGPGWVGWAPQSASSTPRTTGGRPNCPPGRNCMAVVSAEALQNGKPITSANLLAIDLGEARGHRVGRPDVPPSDVARLVGTPVPRAAAFLGTHAQMGGTTARGTTGVAPASRPVFRAPAPVRVREGGGARIDSSGRAAPSWSAPRSHSEGSVSRSSSSSAPSGGARSSGGGFSGGSSSGVGGGHVGGGGGGGGRGGGGGSRR